MAVDDSSMVLGASLAAIVKEAVREVVREELALVVAAIERRDMGVTEQHATALLTVKQVAEQLQVTEPTVRDWIRTDKLRAHDLAQGAGRRREYRVRREDVEGLLRGQRRAVTQTPDTEALASNIVRLNRAKVTERS